MNYTTCGFCGDTYPNFDVAHVCSKGPFAPKVTTESDLQLQKHAQSVVEECRQILLDVYNDTPLELCGPLLRLDEKIVEHFYGEKK